jgi:DNA invertase Pin-like site-specific DNA recombinase
VFREVAARPKTDRAQLRRVLDQLDAGDVLMVTRLERLARSTRGLLNTLAAITAKKAGSNPSRRRTHMSLMKRNVGRYRPQL